MVFVNSVLSVEKKATVQKQFKDAVHSPFWRTYVSCTALRKTTSSRKTLALFEQNTLLQALQKQCNISHYMY